MTDPASRGRSLPNRWFISLLLVASLLSIVLAGAASTTTGATKAGNDVTDTFSTRDRSNAILDAIDPDIAESSEPPRDTQAARHDTRTGQSILHFRGACLDNATRCVGDTTHEEGAFFLNAPASGVLFAASWRAANDSLRTLRVIVGGLEIEGESPIRFHLDGLAAGEHIIRVEPANNVVGVHDQVVDWTASFVPGVPFSTVETRGRSSYHMVAGCAVGACDPLTSFSSDRLIVPWRALGTLTATWDPEDGPRRVSIPGTGFVAEGEPPLSFDLSGLDAGEWSVRLEPVGPALPLGEASVSWLAQLAQADARGEAE